MVLPKTLVIFDSEFTAWDGSAQRGWSEPWEYREVIQMSALCLQWDGLRYQTLATFDELVTPTINPILSDYITQLTGIEQSVLDRYGVPFRDALNQFYHFCNAGQYQVFAWGADYAVVLENCGLNKINMPQFEHKFVNLRANVNRFDADCAQLSSGQLAHSLGHHVEGQNHNALHDVKSIAVALNHWVDKQVFLVE